MNNYIQNKLDTIDIFDYIVFEDGDIDKEKSNEKLKELFTDYRNNIVDMLAENKQDYKLYDGDIITAITMPKIREVLSLLQDTNK